MNRFSMIFILGKVLGRAGLEPYAVWFSGPGDKLFYLERK